VEPSAVFSPAEDETELAIRRKAATLAAQILDEEIPKAISRVDHHFVGTLERRLRRAGAEDLIVLVTNGRTVPAPPSGSALEENFSVSIALEYRGHWIRVSRTHGRELAPTPGTSISERLDTGYPYEVGDGTMKCEHREYNHNGKRLFQGDTIL